MHRQIEIKCTTHRLQTAVLLRLGKAKLDAAETFLSEKNRLKSFYVAPRKGEIRPACLYPEYRPFGLLVIPANHSLKPVGGKIHVIDNNDR